MARSTDKRWKGILIDWEEISDMDAEDYELKPLNQQQTAILLALLEYQKWPTRWVNLGLDQDELETFIADIEQRLMRNEEGFTMTPEELSEAICNGLVCAAPKIGLMLASGVANNGSFDEDGNIILPDSGTTGGDLPTDDPDTVLDESAMALMGAAIQVSKALEVLYDKLDNYYGAVNGTPATSVITVALYLSLYFPVDEVNFGDAVQDYYDYRMTNNRLLWDTSETQQNVLFCQGANLTGWNKWLIDYSGFAAEKIAVMSGLSNALAPAFWSSYFDAGIALPSTQYLDAPCVPIAYQELTPFTFDVARSTSIVKANHRMLITFEGYATDTDGDVHDWFWYREEPSGVNTWTPPTITFSAGSNLPSQTEVAYRPDHKYSYTLDLANLANNPIIFEVNRNAGFLLAGMTQNAAFKITLTDLGQHTII